jgi:hypothetical protein
LVAAAAQDIQPDRVGLVVPVAAVLFREHREREHQVKVMLVVPLEQAQMEMFQVAAAAEAALVVLVEILERHRYQVELVANGQ